MVKKISYILLCLLYTTLSFSQELAKYNQYHYSVNYINPAATASGKCKIFNLSTKNQWIGIKDTPSIQALSIQIPNPISKTKKHGLGVNMVHDKNGASRNLNGEFIYSYHSLFGKYHKHYFSFGLSGNIGQYSFDESDFTANLNDPIITYGIESEISYNAASGLYIYGEDYFAGIGVYNLLPVKTNLYQGYGNERFFLTAIVGYHFTPRRYPFSLKTSVYVCKGGNLMQFDMMQFDINNQIYFDNQLWVGCTYRKYMGNNFLNAGQNMILFLGYQMEKWDFTYAYNIGLNQLQYHHFGSLEFSIGYKICPERYACPAY